MVVIRHFRNKRNENKYIDTKYNTKDRHYMWRQKMVWNNGVTNHVGTKKGGFCRQGKATIDEVLQDYEEISG